MRRILGRSVRTERLAESARVGMGVVFLAEDDQGKKVRS